MKRNLTISKGLILLGATCAALTLASQTAQASSCSSRGCTLPYGSHYTVINNWWGVSSGVNGSQSIGVNGGSWSTSWNWSGGSNYQVKTYAEVVDGWNWSGFNGAPFPYRVSGGHSVNVHWSFSNSNSGTQDVAWDCFFNPGSNPGNSNPTDEMMVWLQDNGGANPLGSYKKTVSVDGASWDLWQGWGSWNVVSFKRRGNTSSASLNLMDFARTASSAGYLNSSHYFLNVDAGTEIFSGHGTLNTSSYGAP